MLKAVIFDYDGVIVNSLEVNFQIYNDICRELGKPTFTSIQKFTAMLNGNWRDFWKDIGIITDKEKLIAAHLYKEGIFRLWNKIPLTEGMDKIIPEMGKKYRLGIVTNTHKNFILDKLRECNILIHFDAIIDWFSVSKRKPHPDQLISCMKELESTPEETVYIGDMEDDIMAGKNAGVKTMAVSWGWHSVEKLKRCNPDMVAEKPEDIPVLLKKI
jgi:HAD superfamily hydrolase (TIGR01509 family)